MKLLYIYAKNSGVLADIELNFCCHRRFHFNKAEKSLELAEHNNIIPDNFFSTQKSSDPVVVESISAIIGDNGAGKTSIAVFLHDLSIYEEQKEHIVVYEMEGYIFCSYTIFTDLQSQEDTAEEDKLKLNSLAKVGRMHQKKIESDAKQRLAYKRKSITLVLPPAVQKQTVSEMCASWGIIYCSNFYSPLHLLSTVNNFTDLSTSYLIKQDYEKFINNSWPRDRVNPIVCHDYSDFFRFIQWLAYCHENNFDWKFAYVNRIVLDPLNYDLKYFIQEQKHNKKDYKKCDIDAFINDSYAVLLSDDAEDTFLVRLFRCFLGNWLRYNFGTTVNNSLYCVVIAALKRHFTSKPITIDDSKVLGCLEDIICTKHFADKDILCFKEFRNLTRMINSESMTFDLDDENSVNKLLSVFRAYELSHTITHYLTFKLEPALSAGELAQYQLFSRLFDLKVRSQKYNTPLPKNLILFFDEIEITVHPSLQRNLVENVIKFCENVFHDNRIHLLFASHSPVLLSDIPSQNVVLLKRDNKLMPSVNYECRDLKTFGANIHDLYRHSFFLNDGLIGSFAKAQIDDVVDCLAKEIIDSKQKIRQLIDIIDEPLIHEQLLREYFRIFEPSFDEVSWLKDLLAKSLKSKANLG